MRNIVLAILAGAAALVPAVAAPAAVGERGPIVRNGPHPVPVVRIHVARPPTGTSWQSSPRGGDMRHDDMDGAPGDPYDEPYGEPLYDEPLLDDPDPAFEDERIYPEARRGQVSERFRRDGDGDGAIRYDRDYPYDYRYGAQGAQRGGYTRIETVTVVTEPSTIRYVDAPVAVHRVRPRSKMRARSRR